MATTDTAFRWVSAALEPLAAARTDEGATTFIEQLGFTLPVVPASWRELAGAADDMLDAFADVIEAGTRRANGDDTSWTSMNVELALRTARVVGAASALGQRLRSELPAAYVATTRIADELVPRLYACLVEQFVRTHFPRAHALGLALGVIETRDEDEDAARSQPAYTHVEIRWSRLATLLSDPAGWAREVYGWGTDELDTERLFRALLHLSYFLAAPAEIHYPALADLEALAESGPLDGDSLVPELWLPIWDGGDARADVVVTPVAGSPQRLAIGLAVRGSIASEIQWRPGVTIALSGAAQIANRAAVVLAPGESPRLVGVDPDATGRLGVEVRAHDPARPTRLLAISDHTWLDVETIAVGIAAEVRDHTPDAVFELALAGARFAIAGGDRDGDGLLAAVLPEPGIEARFDARLVWSATHGVRFAGAGGLELVLPTTTTLGPVRLRQVTTRLEPSTTALTVAIGLGATVELGPLLLGVDGVGVRATLDLSSGAGNLGPVDLDLALDPPSSVSIALAGGPVSGGGMLARDPTTGRYSGALAVRVFNVDAAAFGILDTRAPETGFSFVAAIGTRFPGIPIGLGFTLEGIGGVLGVHRTVDIAAAREAVRRGGISGLLSIDDPIERAPDVLRDMGTLFPVKRGRHVLGPSARIGWGSPQVLVADVAALIEVPAPVRVTVLAGVRIGLPTLATPVVDLRLDAVGVVDLARLSVAIDASLHDSTLAGYPLSGDMAARLRWWPDPELVAAIGGFHPAFAPPAGFPTLRRIQLVIGDNPQLSTTAYLAITPNTVQLGAHSELTFKGGGFSIDGHVGFDALLELVPLHFEVDIEARAAISYHSLRLASVGLDLVLSGPWPWHAVGEATFGVLWWDVSVGFDVTWGNAVPLPIPVLPDIAQALVDALERVDAWTSELPPGERPWIAYRSSANGPRVDPLGCAVVRQHVAPLAHDLTQFGSLPLPAARRFEITRVDVDGNEPAHEPVREQFAPAQFTKLTVDERLTAPSFELFDAGARIANGAHTRGTAAHVPMEAVTRTLDPLAPPTVPTLQPVTFELAATRPTRPTAQPARSAPPRVRPLTFTLASTDDLSITAEAAALVSGAQTYASAREALRRHTRITGTPPALQVVPRVEASS